MRHAVNLIIGIFLIIAISGNVSAQEKWKLKKKKAGISVYLKDIPGSDFKAFKAYVTLDEPIEVVNRAFDDIPGMKAWLHDCLKSVLVAKGDNYVIQYIQQNAPWPVSDRDVVIKTIITKKDDKIIRSYKAIKHPSKPPKSGYVRMPQMTGTWIIKKKGDNKTLLVYQNKSNPGGSLPSTLVNLLVTDIPFNTLQNLKKSVKKYR